MKQSKIIISILLFTLALTVSCSDNSKSVSNETESAFRALFPDVTMNESFELKTRNNDTTFTKGSNIILEFTNKSAHTIVFDPSLFIKQFTLENEKWVEVQNKATYSGQIVLSPRGTILTDRGGTGVSPVFEGDAMGDVDANSMLRIVMVGEILENDLPTGELVGAYIDMYLVP